MTNWILNDKGSVRPVNAQVDASAASVTKTNDLAELTALMRRSVQLQDRILTSQNRQNELLTVVIELLSANSRQRATELALWKQSNPRLARACKDAASKLEKIHTEFLDSLSDEIDVNFDILQEGDFALGDFVDKYGSRIVHLNTLLQVLTQLGNAPDIIAPAKEQ